MRQQKKLAKHCKPHSAKPHLVELMKNLLHYFDSNALLQYYPTLRATSTYTIQLFVFDAR
jgi:hypothetical protein